MKPATVVMCGLIRNPDMAILQLSRIMKLRAEGLINQIIVSTWDDELDRYRNVLDILTKCEALVIESSEPALVAPGHVVHQSKALTLALEACPDDAMILKVRPDIMMLTDDYRAILAGERGAAHLSRAKPTLFEQPVWIHSGMPFYPFYFNDIVYYGAKRDLVRMADIDLKSEILLSGMMPEQFFHLAPVLPKYAVLKAFARIQRAMVAGDQTGNLAYARELLKSPFWHRVWALSIRLLLDNYYVGFQPEETTLSPETLAQFSAFTLEDLASAPAGMPGLSFYPIAAASMFDTISWAAAAAQGRFKPSEASVMLADAMTRIGETPELDDPVNPDPDAVTLAKRLKATVNHYHPKVCLTAPGVRRRRVEEGQSRFGVASKTNEVRELREQVNRLRRENEKLLAELSQKTPTG